MKRLRIQSGHFIDIQDGAKSHAQFVRAGSCPICKAMQARGYSHVQVSYKEIICTKDGFAYRFKILNGHGTTDHILFKGRHKLLDGANHFIVMLEEDKCVHEAQYGELDTAEAPRINMSTIYDRLTSRV